MISPTPKQAADSAQLPPEPIFDLLRLPLVGSFLSWRHSRTLVQIPLLLISVLMILHGLLGPSLAPKNLATVLSWVHFRGVLILVLLIAGNFFCFACPFMLVRNAARRFFRPTWNWPRPLRNKWTAIVLFGAILFCYELFDLWSSPWLTAWIIAGYFLAALAVDSLFKHASFCKYLCPIGQFNFIASTVSPLSVQVRDTHTCSTCTTKDCIRGTRQQNNPLVVLQRGCELALFQPQKVGNLDCTFCLDCVHACPHDNIGILSRPPAEELAIDPTRSGIGQLSRRKDISALAVLFTFGALMNAFGMVSPIYALENWLAATLHIHSEAPILGLIFAAIVIIDPLLLLGAAAWLTWKAVSGQQTLITTFIRYSYTLIPVGFGMWLAHYSFHFLTGVLTIVPVAQSAAADLGYPFLGAPQWSWLGLSIRFVQPLQMGFLILGFAGSLIIAWRLAEEDREDQPLRAFLPWAALHLLLLVASVWLMTLPMDMRATLMSG